MLVSFINVNPEDERQSCSVMLMLMFILQINIYSEKLTFIDEFNMHSQIYKLFTDLTFVDGFDIHSLS